MHPWIGAFFFRGDIGIGETGMVLSYIKVALVDLIWRILKTGKKILVFNESCVLLIKSLPCNALSEVLDKIAVFKVFPKKVNIVVF